MSPKHSKYPLYRLVTAPSRKTAYLAFSRRWSGGSRRKSPARLCGRSSDSNKSLPTFCGSPGDSRRSCPPRIPGSRGSGKKLSLMKRVSPSNGVLPGRAGKNHPLHFEANKKKYENTDPENYRRHLRGRLTRHPRLCWVHPENNRHLFGLCRLLRERPTLPCRKLLRVNQQRSEMKDSEFDDLMKAARGDVSLPLSQRLQSFPWHRQGSIIHFQSASPHPPRPQIQHHPHFRIHTSVIPADDDVPSLSSGGCKNSRIVKVKS